jgi:hypothetical protein
MISYYEFKFHQKQDKKSNLIAVSKIRQLVSVSQRCWLDFAIFVLRLVTLIIEIKGVYCEKS